MNGFLFDENIPTPLRFVPSLPIIHATTIGPSVSDAALWAHARANALVIVTKAADFVDRAMHGSPPPWVVHVRVGNQRRGAFDALLAAAWPQVQSLLPAHKLVSVFADRIEAVRD